MGEPAEHERGIEMARLKPSLDRVHMDTLRARTERALFGVAEPARLGRFVLLDRLGGGGMGVVYAAYDPELDRKVALKLLHPRRDDDERARQRLAGEAQSLAKLDHPNVVKVHDVIAHDGGTVIVMELASGYNLAVWEQRRPRSWREIVDIYARAGDGLAAAHGVGVVHRDFKPTNVVVGDDARVRVLDFGLARFSAESGPQIAGESSVPVDSLELTRTDEVVGTLAFGAPEQLSAGVVTAASDQFSFCVALHRAIEGVPAFDGVDAPGRVASITRGTIRVTADRPVPAWLRAVISRGLRANPADRFSSMTVLLHELRRPRGWRRWRTPALATAAIVATLTAGLALGSGRTAAAECDGDAAVEAVWNPGQRARVEAQLGLDAIDAPEVRRIVTAGLDGYSRRLLDSSRDACVRHRDGTQSDELLDRRMLCLHERLGDLAAAVGVLAEPLVVRSNAIDVVVKLPPVDECADVERLQAAVPPPRSELARSQVVSVRGQISQAVALDRAGRSAEARATAQLARAAAHVTGYQPAIAEAALTEGRILLEQREFHGAADALRSARALALRHHMPTLAVEAAARLIYVEGMERPDPGGLGREAAIFEPLSASLPAGDHFARPLLLNNVGAAYMAAERRADALRYFRGAHDALVGVAQPDPELACVDKNLAMLTHDDRDREALARGVWERRRALLGEAHLQTVEALDSYARFVADPARALPLIREVCALYRGRHPRLVAERASCESYRAFLTELVGDIAGARRILQDIVELSSTAEDRTTVSWRDLAVGHLALARRDLGGARIAFTQVTEAYRDEHAWWELMPLRAELALSRVDLASNHREEARRRYAVALAGFSRATEMGEDAEPRLRIAEMANDRVGNVLPGDATERE